MRYSIEPKERVYIKGYGFLSFTKNMGKNLSNMYGQKLLVVLRNLQSICSKNCFKKSNSEATGDSNGN